MEVGTTRGQALPLPVPREECCFLLDLTQFHHRQSWASQNPCVILGNTGINYRSYKVRAEIHRHSASAHSPLHKYRNRVLGIVSRIAIICETCFIYPTLRMKF